ncbi:MAG: putative sucraseferredoxin [Ilumatobacteraceae bacterium]|nr:putative sucraseferredoxin [Ilumatobacteraceae bacterium]
MTDRFVCSDASVGRGEVVVATASQVRAWLLIEVHGAWGIDAISDSHLGVHLPAGWKAGLQRRGIRPICIRPAQRPAVEPETARIFFVVAARPGRTEGAVWSRTLPTLSAVRHVTDELQIGEEPPGWERDPGRLALVCTNGKHDQCCANEGRPVVRHLRGTRWADEVWECSHIGGDRFAANLLVLPDSLYFGRMEPSEAEQLLDAHADGQIALEWYRGRSTLTFPEQAAEHALRSAFEVRGLDDVVVEPTEERNRYRAQVVGVGTVDVGIERTVGRTVEPLTCRGTPDQEVPHYTATVVTEVDQSGAGDAADAPVDGA